MRRATSRLSGVGRPITIFFFFFFFSSSLALASAGADRLSAQGADGPRLRTNAAEITIAGRMQAQFNTTSVATESPVEALLRRVRLGATVRVNDVVSGRVHADFAGNRVAIADAYLLLTASPGLELFAGRAFRPFGVMEQTSSLQTIPIERGVRIRGSKGQELSSLVSGLGFSDRDIGLQLRGAPAGAPLGISYAVGVFAGPLQGLVGPNRTQQFVSRVGFTPHDGVSASVAWSRRDFARQTLPGQFELKPGSALVVDLEYGGPTPAPGPHLVAELGTGSFDPFLDETFRGAQLWMAYLFPFQGPVTVVSPLLRLTHATVDRSDPGAPAGGTLVTPGINLYFGGLNRVMLNYDIFDAAGGPTARSFKAQFQLSF